MKKLLCFFCLFFLSYCTSFAQISLVKELGNNYVAKLETLKKDLFNRNYPPSDLPPAPVIKSLICNEAGIEKVWDKRFGGGGTDFINYATGTLLATSDGGYLVGGCSNSGDGDLSQDSRGGYDYWIVKIDGSGTKLWDKRFGGLGDDILSRVIATSDGGFLLGGFSYTYSDPSGDHSQATLGGDDYWIVKIDGSGTKLWDKRFGGLGDDILSSLVATSDGGFLLGGSSLSGQSGDHSQDSWGSYDFWVVKIDGSGTKLWDKRFGGDTHDHLLSMIATSDGDFLLGGDSYSGQNGDKSQSSQGDYDFWVVKIDGSGTKLWDKRFGGVQADRILDMTAISDGSFLLGGFSISGQNGDKSQPSRGDSDFWVVKIDGSGTKLWDKRLGGQSSEVLYSLIATSDGGFLLGGSSNSGQSGDHSQDSWGSYDFWVVKIDGSGTKLWDKRFGGNGDDHLFNLAAVSDGSYLLSGFSTSGQNGDKSQPSRGGIDYWVVKTTQCVELTSVVCGGTTITLEASGCAGTVIWSTGATRASIIVTPQQSMTYTATCTINDNTSPPSNVVSIMINPTATITQQPPIATTVTPGTTATAIVQAIGTNLTYQWYIGSQTTNQPVAGQTSNILLLANAQAGQSQIYYCLVMSSCGSTWSDGFTLTIKNVFLASMYTIKTGNWNDPTVWSGTRVPINTDGVQLNHTVRLPDSYEGQALWIIYNPGGNLIFGTGSQLGFVTN